MLLEFFLLARGKAIFLSPTNFLPSIWSEKVLQHNNSSSSTCIHHEGPGVIHLELLNLLLPFASAR